MGLFEKVAWCNLVALGLGAAFYGILLKSVIAALNFHISFALLLSSFILMILCNFAWIIYYERENDSESDIDNQYKKPKSKIRMDLHIIYWGAFIGILVGTWLWVEFEISNTLSRIVHISPVFLALCLFFLYSVMFRMYKKRKGESIEASPIIFKKVYPAHDERDLMIRKRSRKHLMNLFSILGIGCLPLVAIPWAMHHPGIYSLSFNTAHIPLVFMAASLLGHIVVQVSTIIQYRLGR